MMEDKWYYLLGLVVIILIILAVYLLYFFTSSNQAKSLSSGEAISQIATNQDVQNTFGNAIGN